MPTVGGSLTAADDEALDLIERYYDKAQLTPKSQFMIQELFDNLEIVVQPTAGEHAPQGTENP